MTLIQASAPGRCGIVGNPSDGYGGTVVSCTVDLRAYVEIRPADELRLIVSGQQTVLRESADFSLKGDYFDIARTVLQYLELTGAKVEMRAWSDIPFQSGLSGSTAMYAAVFGAFAEFKGLKPNRYEIAEHLQKIERNLLNMQCGYQDQYMTVFGGLNCMDFREKQTYHTFETEVFATVESLVPHVHELPFIIAHTGVQRVSGSVLRPLRLRWEDGEPLVVDGYRRVGELGRMGKRALVCGDWELLGKLMNENHAVQQSVGASGPANDKLIETARAAGALGAKLAGAGGGGTIVALAPKPEPVMAALREAGASRFMYLKVVPGLEVRSALEDKNRVLAKEVGV